MTSVLSYELPVMIIAIIVYVLTGHFLKRYYETTGKPLWLHESSVVIVLGIVVGGLIQLATGSAVEFDQGIFFYLVLPPIIFAQGYTLKRKNFFKYSQAIVVLGLLGTVANFLLIAGLTYAFASQGLITNDSCVSGGDKDCEDESLGFTDCLILATVLSASDEVAAMAMVRPRDYPKLAALIFGEGVINDALSIVLFHSLHQSSNALGTALLPFEVLFQVVASTTVGVVCGLCNARLLKSIPSMKEESVYQTALILMSGYLSYGLAEACDLSGILTLFFAGIAMAHYSWHSLSGEAQVGSKVSVVVLSDVAEAFSFAYVGISVWSFSSEAFSVGFAFYTLGVMVFVRFLMIFAFTSFLSATSKTLQLTWVERFVLGLGGMVRGSISWAQILQVDTDLLQTTVLIVVLCTVLFSGICMPIIFPRMGLVPERSGAGDDEGPVHIPDEKDDRLHNRVARWFVRVDEAYLKPYFGGSQLSQERLRIAFEGHGQLGWAAVLHRLLTGRAHPLLHEGRLVGEDGEPVMTKEVPLQERLLTNAPTSATSQSQLEAILTAAAAAAPANGEGASLQYHGVDAPAPRSRPTSPGGGERKAGEDP